MHILLAACGSEKTQCYNIDGESIRYNPKVYSSTSEEAMILIAEYLQRKANKITILFPFANNVKYRNVNYLDLYSKNDSKLDVDILIISDIFYRFDLLFEKINLKNIKKVILWLHTPDFNNRIPFINMFRKIQKDSISKNIEGTILYHSGIEKDIIPIPNGFKSHILNKDIFWDIVIKRDKQEKIVVWYGMVFETNGMYNIENYKIELYNPKTSKWNIYKSFSESQYFVYNINDAKNYFQILNPIYEAIANSCIVILLGPSKIIKLLFNDCIVYIENENDIQQTINFYDGDIEMKNKIIDNSLKLLSNMSKKTFDNIIKII